MNKKIILMVALVVGGVGLGWGESPKKAEQQGTDIKSGQNYREPTKEEKIKIVEEEMTKLQKMAEQKEEPREVGEFVKQSLNDIEKVKNDSSKLNRAIKKLDWQLSMYRNTKVYINPKTTQEITKKLIKIFYALDDKETTNIANKIRIIETICSSDNSQDARDFIFPILENGPEKHREIALWFLSSKGLHGEDVYDKIKELIRKGVIKQITAIKALTNAHPQKAIKDIQEIILTTKDLKEFIRAGIYLCDYDKPELIDGLLQRVGEFKPTGYDKPTRAINHKLLKKYIEVEEGEKLKTALKVYKQKGLDNETLPLLESKLNSKNSITRGAVVEFLEEQSDTGHLGKGKVIHILKKNIQKERDKKIKKRMQHVIYSIEKQKR